jgi:hypothetical protein
MFVQILEGFMAAVALKLIFQVATCCFNKNSKIPAYILRGGLVAIPVPAVIFFGWFSLVGFCVVPWLLGKLPLEKG